jgi:hypothetical protein
VSFGVWTFGVWIMGFPAEAISYKILFLHFPEGKDKKTNKETLKLFFYMPNLIARLFVVEHIMDMPQCRPNPTINAVFVTEALCCCHGDVSV